MVRRRRSAAQAAGGQALSLAAGVVYGLPTSNAPATDQSLGCGWPVPSLDAIQRYM
jgi:hypothetical protein